MKIGTFSDQFKIPITTIRYYIDNDILLPMKKNSQYIFTETDIEEMKIILKLKSLTFSTEEIKQFLRIVRMYNIGDERINQHIIEAYINKKKELEKTQKDIKKAISTINEEIQSYSTKKEDTSSNNGIPFSFVDSLACPRCNKPLDMSQVKIIQNKIQSGQISCNCGYNASIEEGIILVNSDVSFYNTPEFKVQHYGSDNDQSDFVFFEHMKRFAEHTIALNLKAYAWIDSIIENDNNNRNVIFMPDIASHYLYKYIDKPYFRNAIIVVSGFTKETIKSIKAHIDSMQNDLDIVYIANTIYDLPLKKNVFDLWIDATSSYNFSFFHEKTLHELVTPFFKKGSIIVGLTKYVDPGSKSLKSIRENYNKCHKDNSKLDMFIEMVKSNGWKLEDKIEVGTVTDPGDYYEYIIDNEKHHYLCYFAEKTE